MSVLLVVSTVLAAMSVVSTQSLDLIDDTDITFVIDTSGSISHTSYQYVKQFMENVILEINVGPENSRVAVITFNEAAVLHFNLNQYTNQSSLITAIRNIPKYNGGTDIPEALYLLRNSALNGSLGIRNSSRQIAILFTDGGGGDVAPAAAALSEIEIFQVFSVGVDNARIDQLNLIASKKAEFVYYRPAFTEASLIIIAQEIIERLKASYVVLQPHLGSMLGGTIIQVMGNNIIFSMEFEYYCGFDNLEVSGVYTVTPNRVVCVSPSLNQPGRVNFCLRIMLSLTARSISYCTTYHSLLIEDTSSVLNDNDEIFLFPTNRTTIRWSPTSIVPQNLQNSLLLSQTFGVDISFYELNTTSQSYSLITVIASNVSNTGALEVTVPNFNLTDDYVTGFIGVSLSEQFNVPTTRNTALIALGLKLLKKAIPTFRVVYLGYSPFARSQCARWVRSQPNNIGEEIRSRLPPCPPTVREASQNQKYFIQDNHLIWIFHPGAAICYRQITFNSANHGSGQQCCYDRANNLIVGPSAGGTVDLYSPSHDQWKHFEHDVLPHIYCCRGLFSDCSAYYEHRPSDNGTGYYQYFNITPPGRASGDPHIVTLDGFKYTFNGRGEFILIEHVDRLFMLQGRMVNMVGQISVPATVFSAVVGKQSDSDTVQFEINQQQNDIDVIVAGERVNMDGLTKLAFNNVSVLNLGGKTYAASFSNGVHIETKEEYGFVSVLSVHLPDSFRDSIRGLMGNFNGNQSDDLMASKFTTPISINASLFEIHNQFGLSWFTTTNNSLFTYNQQINQSWEVFYDPFYQPQFSVSSIDFSALEICENNKFCIFDIAATRNTSIGLSTLNSDKDYDEIVRGSYPVICDPPCKNGACIANDTCNCQDGYMGDTCSRPEYMSCDAGFPLCQTGGRCRKLGPSYTCRCTSGYTGLLCEIEPDFMWTAGLIASVVISIAMIVVACVFMIGACGWVLGIRKMKKEERKRKREEERERKKKEGSWQRL